MSYSSLIAVSISIAALIPFGYRHELDSFLSFAAGHAVVLSMIIFNQFWAEHILAFGLMASMAKDANQARHSASAIALLGWIALIILSYIGIF